MVNHCEIHVVFKDIKHQFQENILNHFLLNLDLYSIHLKLPTGNFYDIPYPYKLFMSQYLRYGDSSILS